MSSPTYRALCQIRASNSHVAQVPTPVQLLGQRLVLWRDAEQQWRCFADVCPHRMAPLSGVTSGDTLPRPVQAIYALHTMPFANTGATRYRQSLNRSPLQAMRSHDE